MQHDGISQSTSTQSCFCGRFNVFHVMHILQVLQRLSDHHVLYSLTIDEVMTFTRLEASHLKFDILKPQPIRESQDCSILPKVLPISISIFLGRAIGIPLDSVQDCWEILGEYAWSLKEEPLFKTNYQVFKQHR